MIDVTSKDFPDPVSNQNRYELVGGEIKKWMEITNQPANNKEASWGLDLTSTRIAQIEDYEALFENEMIAQGYGVLYGDESTEPKTNIVDAYGYQEDQAYYFGGSAIKDRGIRGCFVYNRNTGNHIFLPVGLPDMVIEKLKKEMEFCVILAGKLRYSQRILMDSILMHLPLRYFMTSICGPVLFIGQRMLLEQEHGERL